MANGFSVLESLNKSSRAAVDDSPKARFRTKDIPIDKLYVNDRNFYSIEGIEELADELELIGLEENLVVKYEPCEKGDYKIIGGERRYLAIRLLNDRGVKGFDIVTCQIREITNEQQEEIEIILSNSYRRKSEKELLKEASRLKSALEYMRDNNMTIGGYDLQKGALRDVIASIMHKSTTKIAQIESINNNLLPEFVKELEENNISFSVAYELSGMEQEKQKTVLEEYERNNKLSVKEVQQFKKSEAEPEKAAVQSVEQDTDRCETESVSCKKSTDNIKQTDKQKERYEEEQERIDRETKKILREKADEEKMSHLPSESPKEEKWYIKRIGIMEWEDLHSGKKRFYVLRDEGQQEKEKVRFCEYRNGEPTGRTMEFLINYVQREHSGIEETYCILGIEKISS